FEQMEPRRSAAQREWERSLKEATPLDWSLARGLKEHFGLDGDVTGRVAPDRRAKFVGGEPTFAPGPHGRAADLDGKRFLDAGNVGNFGYLDKFTLAAWVYPRGDHGGTLLSRMVDVPRGLGYSLTVRGGKVQALFTNRWLDDAMRVESEEALTPERWQHVVATSDGSR